ncbi:MAG: hypothetical protein Q4G47_00520, partial [Lachnospiraceae bacterium]|nr:hypothetical protein [Lachnospiraceae bacterium]
MNNQPQKNVYKSRSGPAVIILLIVAGVAVNFALKSVVTALGLPMYLDCVGTVVAAALGGYMPGILVGFLTNVIIGLTDVPSLYYCSISVLIAVGAAFSAKRGGFRSIPGIILTTLLLTLIGGGIGSVLTWLLSGQDFGDVASSGLTKIVYSQGSLSPFASQLVADLTVDVVDKAVTVVLSAIVLALIPENAKDVLFMQGWKQAPLPEHMRSRVEERMYRIYSLRSKIVGFLAIAISVIGIVVTLISYTLYHGAILEQAETMGRSIANIAHSCIEPSRVDDYLTLGEKATDYLEVEKELEQVKASSDDIEYVYVYRILEDGCHVVFDVDTADTPGGNPGDIVEFDESFDELLPKLLAGEPIDPIVTDDTFGWLLSVYKPVYDDAGKCMCYACIDISMNKLKVKEQVFFTRIISLFVGFFVVILAIGLWLAEYSIILPINTMALAAGAFAFNSESTRQESIEKIDSLQIVTGDEIENLYESVTKMGDDSMEYIEDSRKKAAQIEKMQSGLIYVLADLVESRDKLTGDHIRKTAAYVRIILDQVRREGLYRDVLTDEFCDDIINSAPLHDIGKIVVPDAI